MSKLNSTCIWRISLKEINPECSLEGLMLKLKLQYFVHLMQRADSFERPRCCEKLWAGGEGDDRGWDGWMTSPIQWTWVWVDSHSWWWTGRPEVLLFMGLQRVGQDWETELNWAELKANFIYFFLPLKCDHRHTLEILWDHFLTISMKWISQ